MHGNPGIEKISVLVCSFTLRVLTGIAMKSGPVIYVRK